MKKILTLLLIIMLGSNICFAKEDKYSQEYLKNKSHFSPMKPMAEYVARRVLKSSLKKETGANFDVKFQGYTISSMKQGIFKNIEITGKDVVVNNIPLNYVKFNSITDYNWVDYTQNPVVCKSDMTFKYEMKLTEEAINQALKESEYNKIISKVNKISQKFFMIKAVRIKIVDNRLYLVIDYNFPFQKIVKDKSFVTSADFVVIDGNVKAKNVHVDSIYGSLNLEKVANLINLLNPLEFTLDLLDNNQYNGIVENVNIVDNKVNVDGKIFVKGKV